MHSFSAVAFQVFHSSDR